jgi:hypothetical protein
VSLIDDDEGVDDDNIYLATLMFDDFFTLVIRVNCCI